MHNTPINKDIAISEIAAIDAVRLHFNMRCIAYDNCSHDGRCFQLCKRDKECVVPAVIQFHWALYAKQN